MLILGHAIYQNLIILVASTSNMKGNKALTLFPIITGSTLDFCIGGMVFTSKFLGESSGGCGRGCVIASSPYTSWFIFLPNPTAGLCIALSGFVDR